MKERRELKIAYKGKVARVNRWHGVTIEKAVQTVVGGQATKHKPRFYKNKDYQNFIDSLAYEIIRLRAEQFPGHVDVFIVALLGSQTDSDSPIKPLFDALQVSTVIENDKKIRDFALTRYYRTVKGEDYLNILMVEVFNEEVAERKVKNADDMSRLQQAG